CPTRELDESYDTHTALGRSLSLCPKLLDLDHKVERRVFGLTSKRALGADIIPLPKLFNIAIEEAKDDPAILVFIHDDIEMLDFFWPYHLVDGLEKFDMVGLAGNSQRTAKQAAWGSLGEDIYTSNWRHFSGTVAMANTDKSDVNRGCIGRGGVRIFCFGPCYKEVKFLDGLFMAVHSDTFHKHDIRFDEQFAFHFYDMDLCRQMEVAGLRMGTVGITLVHDDNNSYSDPSWAQTYEKYMKKWKG